MNIPTGSPPTRELAWPGVLVEKIASLADRFTWFRAAVGPVAVVILALSAILSERVKHGNLNVAVALALAALATAPLLLIRRWPTPALGLVIGIDGFYVVVARLSWPAAGVVGWLFAIAACPVVLRRIPALVLLVLTEICVISAIFVPASVNATPWDASITEGLAALLAWGVGENYRVRRESARHSSEVAEQLRGLQSREAVARGRAEIARELHDVVAHHVSLIAVLAATAPYQLSEVTPAAATAFDEIAAEARSAMADLRTILGVLRTPGGGAASETPQPTLVNLPDLLDRIRLGGTEVRLHYLGVQRPLPEAVELCCYRVVQEALTNTTRHAPGAHACVEIRFDTERVAVSISDVGSSRPAATAVATSGYGLVGMRERVVALGGDFRAGPTARGFEVCVRLPTPHFTAVPA